MQRNGPYQAYFCEENIYRFAEGRYLEPGAEVWVISNAQRGVLMLNQRRGDPKTAGAIVWDYHVVYLGSGGQVYDFDTTLSFGVNVNDYIRHAFPSPTLDIPVAFAAQVRCVDASTFLATFSSDRSHMLTEQGTFRAPPPPWPAIIRQGEGAKTLDAYLDMQSSAPGRIYSVSMLLARFAPQEASREES